jgi:hypothetical protein
LRDGSCELAARKRGHEIELRALPIGRGRTSPHTWRALTPGERLFRGIHRWAASGAHRERVRALGLVDYRLHDRRHHWAVRMVRAGMPLELVARQLGHRDVVMVAKVYCRFVPNHQERDHWEQAAAALDIEKCGQMGTAKGSSSSMAENSEVANVNDASDFDDSRGGTRTRDPGIMSAVL